MPSNASPSLPETGGPVERIGRIADVIATSGAANEALGRLTPEVVDKLHEQRMFRMLLPRVYGGDEVDLVTWFRAMETLGKIDGSTAWCVGQMNGCSATASALAPEVARKIWGERNSALSWGPAIRSRADEVEGGHRLNGEWMFSSGSRHATWIGLMALPVDANGAQLPLPPGATIGGRAAVAPTSVAAGSRCRAKPSKSANAISPRFRGAIQILEKSGEVLTVALHLWGCAAQASADREPYSGYVRSDASAGRMQKPEP